MSAGALQAADELVAELVAKPVATGEKGAIQKVAYTHEAMIELLIEGAARPGGISQKEIAAHFGYTEGWISRIFASEAFQERLYARKEQLLDPTLRASVKERLEALVRRSIDVLEKKLDQPVVSDTVALRALELGARGLGVGGNAPRPADQSGDRLERLAHRLIDLQSTTQGRTVNGEVVKEALPVLAP